MLVRELFSCVEAWNFQGTRDCNCNNFLSIICRQTCLSLEVFMVEHDIPVQKQKCVSKMVILQQRAKLFLGLNGHSCEEILLQAILENFYWFKHVSLHF